MKALKTIKKNRYICQIYNIRILHVVQCWDCEIEGVTLKTVGHRRAAVEC